MKWFSCFLALVCGLLLGYFFFGRAGDNVSVEPIRSEDAVRSASADPRTLDHSTDRGDNEEPVEFSEAWLEAYEEMTPVARYASLVEMMGTLSPDDYPRILNQLRDQSGDGIWNLKDVIQRQWAVLDPRGMLAYIETLESPERYGLRNTVFREWAKRDFESAWAAFMNLPEASDRNRMVGSVLSGAAMESPHRVLELLEAAELPAQQTPWMYRSVFQAMAEDDSAQAQQMAAAMPPGEEKKFALLGSLKQLIEDDFPSALAWLDSLPMDSGVYRARAEMLQGLHSKDFDSIREIVDSQTDPKLQKELLKYIQLQNAAHGKPFDEVLDMLSWMESRMGPRELQNKMHGMIYALAESDLSRATEYVMNLPYGQSRMNALGSIASKLAQEDLEAVVTFADSLEYDDERKRVLESISYHVMRDGAESAAAFVLEHDDPILQQRIASQLVREWTAYDRESAMAWMAQLSDDDAFRNAQRELVKEWGKDDPAGTARYIETEIDEEKRARAYSDAITSIAYEDPLAAIAWLDHLPEGGVKTEKDIYQRITGAYVNVDPLAATEWVADMERGDLRDATVKALAQNVVRFEPDSAFIWANSVDDAKVRKDTQSRTIREWAERDPDAAYEAVKDARIDAEEKVPLFEEIEKQRERKSRGSSEFRSGSSPVMISVVN